MASSSSLTATLSSSGAESARNIPIADAHHANMQQHDGFVDSVEDEVETIARVELHVVDNVPRGVILGFTVVISVLLLLVCLFCCCCCLRRLERSREEDQELLETEWDRHRGPGWRTAAEAEDEPRTTTVVATRPSRPMARAFTSTSSAPSRSGAPGPSSAGTEMQVVAEPL